jgi:hypothetical protein
MQCHQPQTGPLFMSFVAWAHRGLLSSVLGDRQQVAQERRRPVADGEYPGPCRVLYLDVRAVFLRGDGDIAATGQDALKLGRLVLVHDALSSRDVVAPVFQDQDSVITENALGGGDGAFGHVPFIG